MDETINEVVKAPLSSTPGLISPIESQDADSLPGNSKLPDVVGEPCFVMRFDALEERMSSIESAVAELAKLKLFDAKFMESEGYRRESEGRLRALMSLFRLIYSLEWFGRKNFTPGAVPSEEEVKSLRRRISVLVEKAKLTLDESGVRVVAPMPNDKVCAEEHSIVGFVPRESESDIAGCIAECESVGYWRHNHVVPAEVYVFADDVSAETKKIN